MVIQLQYSACLRQVFSSGSTRAAPTHYSLFADRVVDIGQSSNCQIVLDAAHYLNVSSRHLEIRPITSQPLGSMPNWQVCDLGSSEGTYVNGQRLQSCQTLNEGDRISIGQQDAEFIFECQAISPILPGGALNIRSDNTLRLSQLVPFLSTKQDLFKKAHLIPGILTVLLVVGLLALSGYPPGFNALLSIYLIGISYYFIYQLCGKSKPGWLLVGSAIATIVLLLSPILTMFIFVFREILPGRVLEEADVGLLTSFIHNFFGAGLLEELIKALPVFAALLVGRMLKSPWRERIGVWEPLDGILIATASAVGFTLYETLGEYVPVTVQQATVQFGAGAGELFGIQLLIPRIIGAVAMHIAYSGYFGYFIGLSVLKPSKRWPILLIGYLTAATLHALWNTTAVNVFALPFAGILSYAFLMAAILKARQLSPMRSQNWATQYFKPSSAAQSPFFLYVRHRIIPLAVGVQLRSPEIPGLITQGPDGVVAEVKANPKDPTILGLQNCSTHTWIATLATGQQKQVDPSRSLKLTEGIKIDFGPVRGEVRL